MLWLKHVYHQAIHGPVKTIQRAVFFGSAVVVTLLGLAVLFPTLAGFVLVVASAYGVLLLTLTVLLLARVLGKLKDLRALCALEGGLRRAGYAPADFFTEGAAATPSFQLVLLKCLSFCNPQRILELGSGQTTKVLAHYFHSHPGTSVITLEQDKAWAERLRPQLTVDGRIHDYRISPLEARTIHVPGSARPVQTKWYRAIAELRGKRFGLIVVDGPDHGGIGTDCEPYSRVGVLELMPAILDENWIVIFDDAERIGEIMTVNAFQSILEKHQRPFVRFELEGEKTQSVFCSPCFAFLRSI